MARRRVDRHGDKACHRNGQIGYNPFGTVFGQERDLIAFAKSGVEETPRQAFGFVQCLGVRPVADVAVERLREKKPVWCGLGMPLHRIMRCLKFGHGSPGVLVIGRSL